jgi:hypothetical protein
MTVPQSAMLSVYEGQRCLGHIVKRGARGFEAFDLDDNSLGVFPTDHEAADAVHAAHVLRAALMGAVRDGVTSEIAHMRKRTLVSP